MCLIFFQEERGDWDRRVLRKLLSAKEKWCFYNAIRAKERKRKENSQ